MGAWVFASSRIREVLPAGIGLTYAGRPKSASPSEGSKRRHDIEQGRLLSGVSGRNRQACRKWRKTQRRSES